MDSGILIFGVKEDEQLPEVEEILKADRLQDKGIGVNDSEFLARQSPRQVKGRDLKEFVKKIDQVVHESAINAFRSQQQGEDR